jgi:hypothetical protein
MACYASFAYFAGRFRGVLGQTQASAISIVTLRSNSRHMGGMDNGGLTGQFGASADDNVMRWRHGVPPMKLCMMGWKMPLYAVV